KVRAAGVELEGDLRLSASLSVTASSGIIDSRFKGNTSLRDNRVPQVPEYNVGVNIRYNRAGWVATSQVRVTGMQFEDDLNAFPLRRATVVDLFGNRAFTRRVTVFAA